LATKNYYFSGVCEWAKLTKPDTKFNAEGIYSIDLFLDDASWAKFHDSGVQLKVKERNGQKYTTFKRPQRKLMKGEIVELGRPIVLDNEDNELNDPPVVGNGSRVTVKVAVYDTAKGKGSTLEKVRIDELVAYDKPEDGEAF
jgi:hypothetical protein